MSHTILKIGGLSLDLQGQGLINELFNLLLISDYSTNSFLVQVKV